MNYIAQAVEPLRAAAIDRAAQEAQKIIDRVIKDLSENGWDARIVAPFPNHRMSPSDYAQGKAKHEMYRMITESNVQGSLTPRTPDIRKVSAEREQRFIDAAKADASAQYDAFIAKLADKVNDHTGATLEGNHVWGHSILYVTFADGSVEKWKTQMIVNVSKLGKLFNQFPTRKVK